jgi:hypothetical protein
MNHHAGAGSRSPEPEAVQAITDTPRAVQGAMLKAKRSNAGRRQVTTLADEPGGDSEVM